jgi:hypothetical protein
MFCSVYPYQNKLKHPKKNLGEHPECNLMTEKAQIPMQI